MPAKKITVHSKKIVKSSRGGETVAHEVDKAARKTVVKTTRKKMNAKEFKKRESREHFYEAPDMVLGSDEKCPRQVWVYDDEHRIPMQTIIDFPPVPVGVFLEIIANCVDGINRSLRLDWAGRGDKPTIEITMVGKTVTMKNYGFPIPIEPHPQDPTMLIPTSVFGDMFSGSNYQEERHEGGRNGIGAKAANIFSHKFTVDIYDGDNGKHFTQTWTKNMTQCEDPIIEDIDIGTESSVEVSYDLDFERFGYSSEEGYPPDVIAYFANIALGNSFTSKTYITFNDYHFKDYFHIVDYGRLYFGDAVETAIIYYELKNPKKEAIRTITLASGQEVPIPVEKNDPANRHIVPRVEALVVDPPEDMEGVVISFACSLFTYENGCHVDAVYNAVVPAICSAVNDNIDKGEDGKNKENPQKIAPRQVKPLVSMIVSAFPVNPKFPNQYKSRLESPSMKYKMTPEHVAPCLKWNLIETLERQRRAMEMVLLKRMDGRKVKNINLDGILDANWAGGPKAEQTELWILEGKSAMGYGTKLMSEFGPEGRNRIGVMCVRGKVLNTLKASVQQIANNKELSQINKVLGLKVEADYRKPEDRKKLRYGRLVLMTDADDDGAHIKTLLLLAIYVFHPELIEMGFVYDYRTKYLKGTKGKKKVEFFTKYEFEEWKEQTADWQSWKFAYFKGLGTSTPAEIKEDAQDIERRYIKFVMDEGADEIFRIAFGTETKLRKDWIEEWPTYKDQRYVLGAEMPISTYFRFEFIQYILMSLERAIPKFADGFKRSQGQILWGVMKHWPAMRGDKYKVAQLSGFTATKVEYKHNEQCLSGAIINMARDFTSSNNLPLVLPEGCFGTRMWGGKDSSSPRYICTKPNDLLQYIFRKSDQPILELIQDEGQTVEPYEFFPVIPTALLNGCHGIATAYSSTVANYNPFDIIQWIMYWMTQNDLRTLVRTGEIEPVDPIVLVPWYRGFTGEIGLFRGRPIRKKPLLAYATDDDNDVEEEYTIGEAGVNDELTEPVENEDGEIEGPSMEANAEELAQEIISSFAPPIQDKYKYDAVEFRGKFKVEKNGNIVITELPIGRWFKEYAKNLEKMREKKLLTSVQDQSTAEVCRFVVKGFKGRPSLKKLGLIRRVRLSNMVFLDQNRVPKRFTRVDDYLKEFCEFRREKYEQRRVYEIENMQQTIEKIDYRIKFIQLVIDGTIVIYKRPKSEVLQKMTEHDIPGEILPKINLTNLTEDEIEALMNQRHELADEIEAYQNMSGTELWYNELIELQNELMKEPEFIRRAPGMVLRPNQPFPSDIEEARRIENEKNQVLVRVIDARGESKIKSKGLKIVKKTPSQKKKPVIKLVKRV